MKHKRRLSMLSRAPFLASLITPLVLAGCGGQDPNDPTGPATAGTATPGTAPTGTATTGADIPSIQELAFPGRTGELRHGTFQTEAGPVEIDYQLIDGQGVFEGDILLPADEPDYRSGGVSTLGKRWPNAVVNVEATGLFNDSRVTAAIQHWQANSGLRFNVGATGGNRIRFVVPTDGSCSSFVGMQGGVQLVNLGPFCSTGNAIHEIGHAIGLFHEQSRTDRDTFVNINTGCIQSGMAFNFNKFSTDGLNLGPYDINSIMHYGSTAFLDTSKPGCTATITRKDGTTFPGQRVGLDSGDIAGAGSLYTAWTRSPTRIDWDGDGKMDFGVWRPSNATWSVRSTHDTGVWNLALGTSTDVPVSGDYDGDRHGDVAVWRPSTGEWFVNFSRTHTVSSTQWGMATDIPVPGDYDGDGSVNFAVFRPLEGNWYIRLQNGGVSLTQWGQAADIPVPADYDRDGKTDIALWRPSNGTWFIINSSNGSVTQQQWGVPGDVPVAADYDGDGWLDFAIWRPSTGEWWIINSSDGSVTVRQWGLVSDVPIPGDYDGDGAANMTVWRPSNGTWYILSRDQQTFTSFQFGANGDTLAP